MISYQDYISGLEHELQALNNTPSLKKVVLHKIRNAGFSIATDMPSLKLFGIVGCPIYKDGKPVAVLNLNRKTISLTMVEGSGYTVETFSKVLDRVREDWNMERTMTGENMLVYTRKLPTKEHSLMKSNFLRHPEIIVGTVMIAQGTDRPERWFMQVTERTNARITLRNIDSKIVRKLPYGGFEIAPIAGAFPDNIMHKSVLPIGNHEPFFCMTDSGNVILTPLKDKSTENYPNLEF